MGYGYSGGRYSPAGDVNNSDVRISIRVRPGARASEVGGTHDGALVVRVRERAEGGRATNAALQALAEALDVRRRDVVLIAGATSRVKLVDVPDSADARVTALRDAPVDG